MNISAITITINYWMIPVVIAFLGILAGFYIGSQEGGGNFNFAPVFGFVVFVGFAIAAISLAVGMFLT